MDGQTSQHGYTIGSPCEPDSSGELKSALKSALNVYSILDCNQFGELQRHGLR